MKPIIVVATFLHIEMKSQSKFKAKKTLINISFNFAATFERTFNVI